jgi:glycosyltransferase involved in cell wall biosynthesis
METMSQPLISVLLPVWNAAATLPACLQSVLRQTEQRWQCIIVDDGSWDASRAYAQQFADQDPRFQIIAMSHQGLVTALNTGVRHCRGRFIARMDADDLMHRDRLAVQMQALHDNPALAAVGCHVRVFPRRHLQDGRRAYEHWLNGINTARRVREEAFVECPIAHPTLMIRRDVLAACPYRERGWPEDYDLILRLLTHGYTLSVVPQRLLSWRDGPERLSRISPTYALERFTACKAAFLATTFLAGTNGYILWGYGATGKALRRALLSYDKQPAYIVDLHPGRLGKTIHHAPVIPPETLPQVPRRPIVVSVAGAKARGEIRAAMAQMNFQELQHFVCAA